MGNGTEKRDLYRGHPLGEFRGIQKIAGPLIFLFLICGRSPALDSGAFRFGESGKTLAAARFDQLNADMFEVSSSFQSLFCLGDVKVDYRILAGYVHLGEFLFVESEDYAYRNGRVIYGAAYHAVGGMQARFGSVEFGLSGGWKAEAIGEYGSNRPVIGGSAGWDTGAGKLSGCAFLDGEDPGCVLEYAFTGHLDKTGFGIKGIFEQNGNSVIGAAISLRSFNRDLELTAVFRYGLVHEVYKVLDLRVKKTAGPVRFSIGFAPSLVENCLVSAEIEWFFVEKGLE